MNSKHRAYQVLIIVICIFISVVGVIYQVKNTSNSKSIKTVLEQIDDDQK